MSTSVKSDLIGMLAWVGGLSYDGADRDPIGSRRRLYRSLVGCRYCNVRLRDGVLDRGGSRGDADKSMKKGKQSRSLGKRRGKGRPSLDVLTYLQRRTAQLLGEFPSQEPQLRPFSVSGAHGGLGYSGIQQQVQLNVCPVPDDTIIRQYLCPCKILPHRGGGDPSPTDRHHWLANRDLTGSLC